MNKTELINAVASATQFKKKDAEAAVGAVLDEISKALKGGDKVQIAGFGTFKVKAREARVGRNPKTGASIKIEASKAPVFTAGKTLKDSVQ